MNFIGMAGRADDADIQAFIAEHGVGEFAHIIDSDGSLWAEFSVTSQPAFVFIDHSGSVALHYGAMGHDDLTTVVEQLKVQ